MSNLIADNAYRILGLDSSTNQKDVLKRYKEIINRLKIDDYPEYDTDINLPDKFRTEESVNDSLKRLQNIKNNLNEYFFWFNIADTIDENSFDCLQHDDSASYDKAIQIWKNASDIENSVGLHYKKNLTLLYCMMLFDKENDIYLKESLSNWKEIIDSDKFWTIFEKSFIVNNNQTVNSDMISDFRENIVKHVSDIYHDLYLRYDNKKYIKDFQDIFETLGEKTQDDLFKPIHQSIYKIIKQLNKINLEKNKGVDKDEIVETEKMCDNCTKDVHVKMYKTYDDGSILCKECCKEIDIEWGERIDKDKNVKMHDKVILNIHRSRMKLISQLNQLHEIGLYDDEQSRVTRDHAAEAIRAAVVRVHNEIVQIDDEGIMIDDDDVQGAVELVKLISFAEKIAGTKNMKEQLKSEQKTVEENIISFNENRLTFEVNEFSKKKRLVIEEDFIKYDQKKIYYKDVISIVCYEDDDHYAILMKSSKDEITILFREQENADDTIRRIDPFLVPVISDRFTKLIFDKGQTITIGEIDFDKNGYHNSKLSSDKSVLWETDLYAPEIDKGMVLIFANRDNQSKRFATMPMNEPNALIVSALMKSCFNKYHKQRQS